MTYTTIALLGLILALMLLLVPQVSSLIVGGL